MSHRSPIPSISRLQAYLTDNKVAMWSSSGGWHNWERRFVRWAEANGFVVDYAINSDLETQPDMLDRYNLLLSVGHDEYWSSGMRDAVDGFVTGGGNVAFFSGNAVLLAGSLRGRRADHGLPQIRRPRERSGGGDGGSASPHQHLVRSAHRSSRKSDHRSQLLPWRLRTLRPRRARRHRRLHHLSARPLGFCRHRPALRRRARARLVHRRLRGRRLRLRHGERRAEADRERWDAVRSRDSRNLAGPPPVERSRQDRRRRPALRRSVCARRSPVHRRDALRRCFAGRIPPASTTATR